MSSAKQAEDTVKEVDDSVDKTDESSKSSSVEGEQDDIELKFLEERLRTSKLEYEEITEADQLSEAAFDLGFGFIEALFSLFAIIALIFATTTPLLDYTTPAALMLVVTSSEVVRRGIKFLDRFQKTSGI